jgi:hypothetical protein
MELFRTKNASTYITIPLVSSGGSTVTSASSLDSELTYWSDLSAPISMADCTNEAVEIAGEGIYRLLLPSSEMNHDYVYIQIKTPMAVTQHILLNTKLATVSDIWDEPISQHSAVGVVGKALYDIDVNALSLTIDVNTLVADHVSMMVGVASVLANQGLWGTSTMIGLTSILANQVLWGTSSGIAVRSVASQIATMQIDVSSALANVKAGDISILISTASILTNVGLWGTSTMIGVASILSNVNLWGTSIMISTASLLFNLGTVDTVVDGLAANYAQASLLAAVDTVVDAIKIETASILSTVDTAQVDITSMKANDVSILISTASILANVATVDGVVDAILSGMAYGSTGVSVDGASLANQVWRFTISQASTVGMAGAYLMTAGGAADPWLTALPGGYAAGTAGIIIGGMQSVLSNVQSVKTDTTTLVADHVSLMISTASILSNIKTGVVSIMISTSSILSNIAAVQADHVSLMIDVDAILANYSQASLLAAVDTVVDAIYLDTTSILVDTGTTVPGLITGLNNLSAAAVNAEVVDALTVDTYGELGQTVVSAIASLKDKIGFIYKEKRNRKTVTSVAINIYADDAVTVDQKLTHSDNGITYDKGEVQKGP